MLADFYTKPLQGTLFKKFRDAIMGHGPLPTEERVGISSESTQRDDVTNRVAVSNSSTRRSTYADIVRHGVGKIQGRGRNFLSSIIYHNLF